MAKPVTRFICANCGTVHSKWTGRCEGCGEWNTVQEEQPLSTGPKGRGLGGMKGKGMALTDLATKEAPPPRVGSGMAELDRVLGAGWSQPRPPWSAAIPVSANRRFCCKPPPVSRAQGSR